MIVEKVINYTRVIHNPEEYAMWMKDPSIIVPRIIDWTGLTQNPVGYYR
jgi:hypothetical protein